MHLRVGLAGLPAGGDVRPGGRGTEICGKRPQTRGPRGDLRRQRGSRLRPAGL